MSCTYVGIDEAGYGPDLGPLVMTAVAATGDIDRPPRFWSDLRHTVARAGGRPQCVWVDDSKRILTAPMGRERLEAAALLALAHVNVAAAWPCTLEEVFGGLLIQASGDHELHRWSLDRQWALPLVANVDALTQLWEKAPFHCRHWRLHSIRTIVIAPARFNELLTTYESKARVHFSAFAPLIDSYWREQSSEHIRVVGDKHGGRHYYYELLSHTWPDVWIERGEEGPDLSRYVLRGAGRQLELRLSPRGDQADGLVALASMVSKYVRECWMEVFNHFWQTHIPQLRSTAGYPRDSTRFRGDIERHAIELGLPTSHWWRERSAIPDAALPIAGGSKTQ